MTAQSTSDRSRAWVEVDLEALLTNAQMVRRAAGGTPLLPMVKADAYGLGIERVVRALSGGLEKGALWGFGVATIVEAEALRRIGWQGRVVAFSPALRGDFERALAAGCSLTVADLEGLASLARAARAAGGEAAVQVEIDTGMGRSGVPWDGAGRWGRDLARCLSGGGLRWEGVFTHFHSADESDLATTDEQWQRFRRALAELERAAAPYRPEARHAANSAAALRRPGSALDLVRPGIFLYGGEVGAPIRPEPVVSLRARLARLASVPRGATVGYGAEYSAPGPERWGTSAIGYGDGLPRALWTGRGGALVRGKRVPVIGRVSMDVTTLDLTGVPAAEVGDVVTFLGRDGDAELRLDEVAGRCGTISYEVLTGLTARLPRVYDRSGRSGARS
ncbi:MAG: alanine racemase [Longimicrobiaceae bacterium]